VSPSCNLVRSCQDNTTATASKRPPAAPPPQASAGEPQTSVWGPRRVTRMLRRPITPPAQHPATRQPVHASDRHQPVDCQGRTANSRGSHLSRLTPAARLCDPKHPGSLEDPGCWSHERPRFPAKNRLNELRNISLLVETDVLSYRAVDPGCRPMPRVVCEGRFRRFRAGGSESRLAIADHR
jgi:hypothetical protein